MNYNNIIFNIFKLRITQPIIFVCMLYLLYFFPEYIKNITNKIFSMIIESNNNNNNPFINFLNFITSINLLIIISFLGISFTSFSFLFVIFNYISETFSSILAIIFLVLSLLTVPIILLLELLGYIISYVMIVKSLDYSENIGMHITIIAMLIFYGLLLLSTKLNSNVDVNNLMIRIDTYLLIASANMILALLYNSKLFASITIIAFRLVIMDNIYCYKLCDIFFKNKYILQRLAIVSLLTLLLFLLMSIIRLNILTVFMQPIYISGTLVYMLMLLIISSKFYEYHSNYFNAQIMIIISILTFGLIGFFNIAFLHIALIFLVLYLTEKSFEIWYEYDYGVIPVFSIFVMLYLISKFVVFDINFLISLFIF